MNGQERDKSMKDDFAQRCRALDVIALALEAVRDLDEETIAGAGLPTAKEREAVRCAARAARLARDTIRETLHEVNRACERLDADIRRANEQATTDRLRATFPLAYGPPACTTLDEPGTTLREPPRLRTPGENLAEVLVDMARKGQ